MPGASVQDPLLAQSRDCLRDLKRATDAVEHQRRHLHGNSVARAKAEIEKLLEECKRLGLTNTDEGARAEHVHAALLSEQYTANKMKAMAKRRGSMADIVKVMNLENSGEGEDEEEKKDKKRNNHYTIDPSGSFMARWDILIAMLLLCTATITPFEVSYNAF